MAKGKIAPDVRWFIDNGSVGEVKVRWVKADRQFRALLAVARIARKHRTPGLACEACAWWCPEIDKALARLARVSGAREGTP